MANLTANRVKSATLAAGTADTVTFGKAYRSVEVLNRGTDWIWATFARGQNNDVNPTPTVAGDDCYAIGPGGVRVLADDDGGSNAPVSIVNLVSATATAYTVTGLNPWTGR